jgi:hypothetical protein
MLDQLQNARADHGQNDQRNAQKRQRGRQQMSAVQDMIERQGKLLDHAQSRGGPYADQQRPMPPSQPTAPQADDDAARDADKNVQQALRRALGELMQQFGDLTGKVPDSLGKADQDMQAAAEALGKGEDGKAGTAEQAAIAALQKGGQQMGQEMARQFGPPQPGEAGENGDDPFGSGGMSLGDDRGDGQGGYRGHGSADRGDGRDPLGRRYDNGTSGTDESADVTVPDAQERQRTQAIQEELRRRGAERDRPQEELDYIDRLLKQF